QLARQQREEIVRRELRQTQQRDRAPLRVVKPREHGALGAHAAKVVRELPLQKARGVGAADAQRTEILELDRLKMSCIHIIDPSVFMAAGAEFWHTCRYADQPREELSNAFVRSVHR